jgi:hypothetical protein
VLFGSGYVLLAYLKADLVERWHWLTSAQLLDAVAVGQFTPGPLSSTATFIGYVLGGLPGAAVATLGGPWASMLLGMLTTAATFYGLTAGIYTYQLSGMTSANWNNVNSFQDNWTGTIVIPNSSIAGDSRMRFIENRVANPSGTDSK